MIECFSSKKNFLLGVKILGRFYGRYIMPGAESWVRVQTNEIYSSPRQNCTTYATNPFSKLLGIIIMKAWGGVKNADLDDLSYLIYDIRFKIVTTELIFQLNLCKTKLVFHHHAPQVELVHRNLDF